jgi:hypothetical protein
MSGLAARLARHHRAEKRLRTCFVSPATRGIAKRFGASPPASAAVYTGLNG